MKTYEETAAALISRKAEYEKNKESRRLRLSLIAAIAAAVIVITAIPVGSIMIASRANQPEERLSTGSRAGEDELSVVTLTNGNNILEKTDISYISEIMITENHLSNITDMTVTDADPSKQPGVMRSYKEGDRFLYINEGLDGNIPVDGGLLRRTNALFAHEFTDEADNYQLDVVFTDGSNEICHETHYGEKSLVGMTDITVDFYLFVPDHLEYGEVHLYLNILKNKTKTVSVYDKDPFIEVCVGFAQKYRCVRTSYGDKAPMTGHEELLRAVIDYDMHDYIYSCVENLYNLNENLGPNIVAERRAVMKEIYTAVLKSYKIENAEEYDRIIEEFCSNEGKIYDRDGNLKDTPTRRHDPLEDMNKNAT